MKVQTNVYIVLIFSTLVCLTYSQASTIKLGGIIRDQAPNTMTSTLSCKGNAGEAGSGFAGTDFQLEEDYQDDEFGLAGTECNRTTGWFPPKCAKIGADQTPVYAYTGRSPGNNVRSPTSFYRWFHDSNQTRNVLYNITLTQKTLPSGALVYQYANDAFFPIDNKGWKDVCKDDSGANHNFAFCLEAHTRFGYRGGEIFTFSGDDDVWVYIDGRLVIDLGSLHPKRTRSISLDTISGLTKGQNYRLDFFYCERHTVYSRMELTTSIEFYCSYYDWCGNCEGTGQQCCNSTIIDTICNDRDACTIDTCSVTKSPLVFGDAGCVHTPLPCTAPNKCQLAKCNTTTGCQITPLNCTDTDPCTIDSCDNNTGCKHLQCTVGNCPPGCVPANFTCNDGNPCTTDNVTVSNTTLANCTNVFNETACNDDNKCTNDFCDSSKSTLSQACIYSNVTCLPPTICQESIGCDRVNGCLYRPKECPGSKDFCIIATCDPIAGCIQTERVCIPDDDDCFRGVCDSESATCKQVRRGDFATQFHNGLACAFIYDNVVKGAVIGAGAAAGIAIGGAAAIGIFGYGGKKGYDYMKLMKNQKFGGVQNNPLYEQTNGKSDNPLYRYSTTDAARA